MSDLCKFGSWVDDDGPAAVVIREQLVPVEGADGVLFPATFAAEQGNDPDRFRGGYNIDTFPDGSNVCLVDSVGSQANRLEPVFASGWYAKLVPRVVIQAGNRQVNLLEAGHRAGDAVVRGATGFNSKVQSAFREVARGNARPLAEIAPTSLVFGVWNSRGEKGIQVRLPRLITSTIRAFNVKRLTRHAQYNPAVNYVDEGLLPEAPTNDRYAEWGYKHQPVGRQPDPKKPDPTHGGVIATGGVRRDVTLSLSALRQLAVREADGSLSVDGTEALRRYILGLALVAVTAPQSTYFRQGCNLVPIDPDKALEVTLVHTNGRREPLALNPDEIKSFAEAVAVVFGVAAGGEYDFDRKLAEKETAPVAAKVKGKIISIDAADGAFKLKPNKKDEVTVTTTDETVYLLKDGSEAAFEDVVVAKKSVEVELAEQVALKVKSTGK